MSKIYIINATILVKAGSLENALKKIRVVKKGEKIYYS